MDAKVEDFVVTPREGKPVEINALWYSALSIMSEFDGILGREKNEYQEKAERVWSSFDIFWNEEKGCCYDVVGGPNGNDQSLRPNQVLAVSVSFSPLSVEKQKIVLGICEQHFLTPNGLRSLSNAHHDYVGEYGGDIWKRDTAYHQGTVWGWLLGPYLSAHLRVFNDRKYIRKRLEQYVEQLKIHGLGSISEIFDGDFPYTPRGCIAQAWSVAAALQVWGDLNQTDQPGSNPSRN
jgi:glycogen debranching enzyme